MKFATSCFLCVCILWMPTCLVNSTPSPSSSTVSASTQASTQDTNGASSSVAPTGSSQTTSDSSNQSTSSSDSLSSSTANTTEGDNSTDTSPTTQSTTTTQMLIFCKNGSCAGNDSSCLNETITDTCILSGSQVCYQIVYTNETDTHYEVGCSDSCDFLAEETQTVTKTTRCCNTNMCNNELLSDPDQGNNAIQMPVPRYSILFLLYLSRFFC